MGNMRWSSTHDHKFLHVTAMACATLAERQRLRPPASAPKIDEPEAIPEPVLIVETRDTPQQYLNSLALSAINGNVRIVRSKTLGRPLKRRSKHKKGNRAQRVRHSSRH